MVEKLQEEEKLNESVIDWTKGALAILEKETWISFFKKASEWIKSLFWISIDKKLDNSDNSVKSLKSEKSKVVDKESTAASSYEYSKGNSLNFKWFTPWPYPFKHITTPYKWIQSYRVDNIKLNPLISFNQLSLKWTEGSLTKLKVKDQNERFAKKTAWYKKNNPCNVSPFKWDVWRSWSSKVADGQNHSKYDSMEDWLASFMRLMRQDRYRNKSIQWINCSWMQWVFKPNEPDSLKALRVTRITHACEHLNISPFQRLNTDDKETMMAWAQETAIRESWSYFNRKTLERAYKKAFW